MNLTHHLHLGNGSDHNPAAMPLLGTIKKLIKGPATNLGLPWCFSGQESSCHLKNWKQNCLMIQQSHCWAHTLRKPELKETHVTCTPMLITALFTITRTWKQPRCPLTDEWIKKLWYIYTMEYYPAIKKNAFESVLMRLLCRVN